MATDRISQLNTWMDAAAEAYSLGDYTTALAKAGAALAIAASLPALSRSAGGGSQSVSWAPAEIRSFITMARQDAGAGLGIQSAPIEFTEPASLDVNANWATGVAR